MFGLSKRETSNTWIHQVCVCLCLKVEPEVTDKIDLHIEAKMSSQERTKAEVGKVGRGTCASSFNNCDRQTPDFPILPNKITSLPALPQATWPGIPSSEISTFSASQLLKPQA